MTKTNYFDKYMAFLRKHELYDEYFFDYFWNRAVHVDIRDEEYQGLFGSNVPIINEKNKLIDLVPCMPFIDNDKAVAIGIYTYVHALTQTPRIGKKHNDNKYFCYILPMFYERIYIIENENEALLKHEEEIRYNIEIGDSLENKLILQSVDELVDSYKRHKMNEKQIARRARRIARECRVINNKNT